MHPPALGLRTHCCCCLGLEGLHDVPADTTVTPTRGRVLVGANFENMLMRQKLATKSREMQCILYFHPHKLVSSLVVLEE